ncbi:MAG: ABC transporter substrate-binding protein [Lachnospiraceae bacterium]|nr:ABC transporter substrate-binding protein [Lachnospiraceae bacterium]
MKISDRIRLIIILIGIVLTVTSCGTQGVTSYEVEITMEGGSGKAYIESPVTITETDGRMSARLIWSSPNYDYMIVDGIRYDNETPGENSTFTIPVESLDKPLTVTGDTVAMSTAHEIEYVIHWGGEVEDKPAWDKASQDNTSQDKASRDNTRAAGSPAENSWPDDHESSSKASADEAGTVSFTELQPTGTKKLEYAKKFSITLYGDYKLIHIDEDRDYLLIPGGMEVPSDVPGEICILKMPLDSSYIVSTSAMDLVSKAGALGMVRMVSLEADDWHVDEVRQAMESGDIVYAGKYRAPDYELIMGEGCDLAVENTMIFHEPAVQEKLEELGIPVMVEMSSYEEHPLGRLEWIRLYGVLFGTEEIADEYFEEQMKKAQFIMEQPDTGLSVAFFHITADGMINVRKPGDYISKMIEMSGGHYIIENKENDDMMSVMNIQMEDFYAVARDADVIIYNSTIGGEITSLDDLISRNGLFYDFKAVRTGRVYCTANDFFQKTTGMAGFMNDLHNALTGESDDFVYLKRVRDHEP